MLLVGGKCRGPGAKAGQQQAGREREARGIHQQRTQHAGRGDERATDEVAEHLPALPDDLQHATGDDVALRREDIGQQRAPGALEGRLQQPDREQDHESDRQRETRQRQPDEQDDAQQVADDHDGTAGIAVGQRRQHRAADDSRCKRHGEGRRGCQGRMRPLEDQQRDGDASHLVAQDRQPVGEEDRPELAHREDLPVRRAAGLNGAHRDSLADTWT